MHIQIATTKYRPLVLLSRTTNNYHCFTKYWHVVETPEPHARSEKVMQSTFKLKNLSPTGDANESLAIYAAQEFITVNKEDWSKAKQREINQLLVLIFYNKSTHKASFPSVRKWGATLLSGHEKHINCEFANNPEHIFSVQQSRALYNLLTCISSNTNGLPSEHIKFQPFSTAWPNIEKETWVNFKYPEQRVPSETFPSTVEAAIKDYLDRETVDPKQTGRAKAPQPIPVAPPEPFFFKNQPAKKPGLVIPNSTFPNTRKPFAKLPAKQNHFLWLSITEEGPHNARKEVFYAQPSNSASEPFPISPLKSTVALLFCNKVDMQPIILSINTNKATQEEKDAFELEISKYGGELNPQQQLQFRPTTATHQPTTSIMPNHTAQTCVECNNEFIASRITSKFCSSICRVQHNSKLRKLSEEEKAESNKIRAHTNTGKRQGKVSMGQVERYGIKFADGSFYKGPNRTEFGLIHNPANKDFKDFAKGYPFHIAEALIEEFPKAFPDCTVELLGKAEF